MHMHGDDLVPTRLRLVKCVYICTCTDGVINDVVCITNNSCHYESKGLEVLMTTFFGP